jgi:GNAT superfamily N-acetyltransferase
VATLRELRSDDLPKLAARRDAGPAWHGDWDHWPRYLAEHVAGERVVFVVEAEDGGLVGYGSLVWRSQYPPFAAAGIPDVSDMVVAQGYRRRGFGEAIIAACEDRARDLGMTALGIGVGLYADYGAAQRLYVRLGFVPDGRGVAYDNAPTTPGEPYRLDDDLVLWLTKPLG